MLRKVAIMLLFVLATTLQASSAIVITLEASGGLNFQSPDGWIKYKGTELDLVDTLGFEDETAFSGWVRLEHPIPIIPNLKFGYTPVKFTGEKVLTQNISFANIGYTAGTKVSTELSLDQMDLTLYWHVPFIELATLGKLNIAFGVNVKYIDGLAKVESALQSKDTTFSAPIPMGFLEIMFRPIGLISIEGQGKFISYGDNTFYDVDGGLRITPFRSIIDLFLRAGYRIQKIKIDDISDFYSDLTVKGIYIEGGISF